MIQEPLWKKYRLYTYYLEIILTSKSFLQYEKISLSLKFSSMLGIRFVKTVKLFKESLCVKAHPENHYFYVINKNDYYW